MGICPCFLVKSGNKNDDDDIISYKNIHMITKNEKNINTKNPTQKNLSISKQQPAILDKKINQAKTTHFLVFSSQGLNKIPTSISKIIIDLKTLDLQKN